MSLPDKNSRRYIPGPIHRYYQALCAITAAWRGDPRRWVSLGACAVAGLMTLYYAFPDEFVRPPNQPGIRSNGLVIFIDNLTGIVPLWPILFLIGFVALFVCLFNRFQQHIKWAHYVNLVCIIPYHFALWIGGFAAPGTYIVTATFATFWGLVNYILSLSYAVRPIGTLSDA